MALVRGFFPFEFVDKMRLWSRVGRHTGITVLPSVRKKKIQVVNDHGPPVAQPQEISSVATLAVPYTYSPRNQPTPS